MTGLRIAYSRHRAACYTGARQQAASRRDGRMADEWARKVGQMLRHVRPGMAALATSRLGLPSGGMSITSPAFHDGGTMPDRYTQDGESLFPPLYWDHIPTQAKSLVLLVEDADAPFPRPLVHAVLHSIPASLSGIPEGGVQRQVRRSPLGFKAGRNSVARAGWMAPSPMPGHGPHRYAFQLLAVDTMPNFANPPGRGAMLRALRSHLIAATRLIGVYQRP
jgi:Raf kinase inhibitor-like YbhB/YbcL family protein